MLQNKGSNNLNITSNGSFTFTTKQTSLSTYNVSILTPPSNQYCTITEGAGFVGNANVTNVDIICKTIPSVASLNEYRFTGELTGVVANSYVQRTLTNAPFQLSICDSSRWSCTSIALRLSYCESRTQAIELPKAHQPVIINGRSMASFNGTISFRNVIEMASAPAESVIIALSVCSLALLPASHRCLIATKTRNLLV